MHWTIVKVEALFTVSLILLGQSTDWEWISKIGGITALVVLVAGATAKHVAATGRLLSLERWRERTEKEDDKAEKRFNELTESVSRLEKRLIRLTASLDVPEEKDS